MQTQILKMITPKHIILYLSSIISLLILLSIYQDPEFSRIDDYRDQDQNQNKNQNKIKFDQIKQIYKINYHIAKDKRTLISDDIAGHVSNEFFNKIPAWERLIPDAQNLEKEAKSILLPFLHIPKTAGSTMKLIIDLFDFSWPLKKSVYPSKKFKSFNSPGCIVTSSYGGTHCSYSELKDCIDRKLLLWPENFEKFNEKGRQYVMSNSKNQIMEDFEIKIKTKFISIVRHPIERVLSEYYWWAKVADRDDGRCANAWHIESCSVRDNLKHWVMHPFNTAHNRQVKSLANLPKMKAPGSRYRQCLNLDGQADHKFFGSYQTLNSNKSLIINAIRNIEENFAFIGIYEDINLSGHLSKIILSYINDPLQIDFDEDFINDRSKGKFSPSHSTNDSKPEIFDREILDMIFERNQLDMVLYWYLKEKLRVTKDRYRN